MGDFAAHFHAQVSDRVACQGRHDATQAFGQGDAGAYLWVDDATGNVDSVWHEFTSQGFAHGLSHSDAGFFLGFGGGGTQVWGDVDAVVGHER